MRDAVGRVLEGVPVRVADLNRARPSASLREVEPEARTDPEGRFQFEASADAASSERATILKVGGGTHPALHVQAWPGRFVEVVLVTGGVLRGQILDAQGRGLAGRALARSGDWAEEVEVEASGEFRFPTAPAGLIDLLARPDPETGAIPASGEAILRAGEEAQVTLRCEAGQTLQGRALTRAGAPAGGATLLMWPAQGSAEDARYATCDAQGEFSLPGLVPGELLLCARLGDESQGPLTVLVPLGTDPEPLELRLAENARPGGRVVDGVGAPVSGASVELRGGEETLHATTSPEGGFELSQVPAGEFEILVRKPGFVTLSQRFRVAPQAARLQVELVRGAVVSGQVVDSQGLPVPGARVEALAPGELHAQTDSEGRFRLVGVPPGGVRLSARAAGHGASVADLLLVSGQSARQDIALVSQTALSGRVSDTQGAALADALVWVRGPAEERQARSDAEGAFRVQGLGRGPFLVSASKPGHRPDARDLVEPGARVDLFLEATFPIRGVVRSLQGAPVHAVLVAPAEAPQEVQFFEGSSFAMIVSAETRQVIVRARSGPAHHGHGPSFLSPQYVDVPPGGGDLEIDLAEGEEAEGIVQDAGGTPLSGVAFLFGHRREGLQGGEAGRLYLLGLSEEGGRFDLAGVPKSGLQVTLSHPQHAPLVVQLGPGPDQSFRLPPGSVLSGRVLDARGAALAGVPIVISGPVLRRTTSDASGRYRAEGLAEGRYRLTRLDTESTTEVGLGRGETAVFDLRGQ